MYQQPDSANTGYHENAGQTNRASGPAGDDDDVVDAEFREVA
jgi:hypothetical protein